MGNEEIQTIQQTSNACGVLVGATVPEVQTSISALAVVELVFGWNNGSPVSREVHAGFCEKLRVRSPRLTHLIDYTSREECVAFKVQYPLLANAWRRNRRYIEHRALVER